jgi:hypothetical protein
MSTSNLIKTMLQMGMTSGQKIYSTLNLKLSTGTGKGKGEWIVIHFEHRAGNHHLQLPASSKSIGITYSDKRPTSSSSSVSPAKRRSKLRMLTLWGLVVIQRESFLKNLYAELNKPVDRQITRIEYPPSLDNDSKVGPKNLCNCHRPPVIPS